MAQRRMARLAVAMLVLLVQAGATEDYSPFWNDSTTLPDSSDFVANDTTTTTSDEKQEETCDLSRDDWLPYNATRGNCPPVLANGSSCLPSCLDGFTDVGAGGVRCLIDDENGTLVVDTWCEPLPCNLSNYTAIEGIVGSDCPELLPSGKSCEPGCLVDFTPVRPMSCNLGKITPGWCNPPVPCPAGYQRGASGTDCERCPLATYKTESGHHHCEPCPDTADPYGPGGSSDSVCQCTSASYANRSDGHLFNCLPCPNNSRVDGPRYYNSVQDCTCISGFLREPPDEQQTLQTCRPPRPCNPADYLDAWNLTGPEPHKLKLGTCEKWVDDENVSDLMPHLSECKLSCMPGTSPQFQSDFFKAVDTHLLCEDGKITEGPKMYTWCSETSFQIPPLVFLATVTLASLIAGCRLESRQHHFEKQCLQALQLRMGPGAHSSAALGGRGRSALSRAKTKVA